MPDHGSIEGATTRARSIALAGWLGEQGIGEITLDGRRLVARTTDLPREVESALNERASVRIESNGVLVKITPNECVWRRKPSAE